MRRPAFLRSVLAKEKEWGLPDWIVGVNGLGQLKGIDLILRLKSDLGHLCEVWPTTRLVWSDMIPRAVWKGPRLWER